MLRNPRTRLHHQPKIEIRRSSLRCLRQRSFRVSFPFIDHTIFLPDLILNLHQTMSLSRLYQFHYLVEISQVSECSDFSNSDVYLISVGFSFVNFFYPCCLYAQRYPKLCHPRLYLSLGGFSLHLRPRFLSSSYPFHISTGLP